MANKTLETIAGLVNAVALTGVAIAAGLYIGNKDLRENNGKVVPPGIGIVNQFGAVYDSNRDGIPDYTIEKTFLITPGTPVEFKRAPTQKEIDWYKSQK